MNRYRDNGFGLWAVCLKDTRDMIGDCGLTLQNIEGEMLPEIGYHIRADHQRKGYAKEAAAAVRDWAFANTDYPALYSYCKYTNVGSYKTGIYRDAFREGIPGSRKQNHSCICNLSWRDCKVKEYVREKEDKYMSGIGFHFLLECLLV